MRLMVETNHETMCGFLRLVYGWDGGSSSSSSRRGTRTEGSTVDQLVAHVVVGIRFFRFACTLSVLGVI